jgi:hypothetical protein
MKKADFYEVKSEHEFKEIDSLKKKAHIYIDSAKKILNYARINKSHATANIQSINYLIDSTSFFMHQADSDLLIANAYRDSSYSKDNEAEAVCLKINVPKVDVVSAKFMNYTVQIGAGNMKQDYFSQAEGVKIIVPNDHVKRYVVGMFNSRQDAKACKEKMIQMGYKDAFIRTVDSLYQ